MKPNTQTSRQSDHSGGAHPSSRLGSNHPLIEYQYHTALTEQQLGGAGSNPKQAQDASFSRFRALSNKFINTEEKHHYALEALFFAIIVAITTWPMVLMIQALADLVK